MSSENNNLNAILESAKAQLEVYRQQEFVATKEIFLKAEDHNNSISGQLIDLKVNGNNDDMQSKDNSSKISKSTINDEEDISNKNFDSSTISLGDQQSFQNQSELTSQTTYTNIHQLTGPIKDEFLVVTGPIIETSTTNKEPSQPAEIIENGLVTTTATNLQDISNSDQKELDENQNSKTENSLPQKKKSKSFIKRLFNIKKVSKNTQ